MPNDAKLGLIVGVGVVILVAVVFFRRDAEPGQGTDPVPASMRGNTGTPRELYRPVKASTSSRPKEAPAEPAADKQHIVKEGETLFSLAEQYLGSKDRFVDLYQVNRTRIHAPDELAPGTVLLIPGSTEPAKSEDAGEDP
jgi:nucleoid-associated protein YgaU